MCMERDDVVVSVKLSHKAPVDEATVTCSKAAPAQQQSLQQAAAGSTFMVSEYTAGVRAGDGVGDGDA
jgi:hypothetical protein